MNDAVFPPGMRWRMRRGMKELDLVFNRWVEHHYVQADEARRNAFHTLLEREDPDIWSWLMGYADAPEESTRDLIEQLRHYC